MGSSDVVKGSPAAHGRDAGAGRARLGGQPGERNRSIPGTRRPARLEENAAALDVTLTEAELARLEPLGEQVVGARY